MKELVSVESEEEAAARGFMPPKGGGYDTVLICGRPFIYRGRVVYWCCGYLDEEGRTQPLAAHGLMDWGSVAEYTERERLKQEAQAGAAA